MPTPTLDALIDDCESAVADLRRYTRRKGHYLRDLAHESARRSEGGPAISAGHLAHLTDRVAEAERGVDAALEAFAEARGTLALVIPELARGELDRFAVSMAEGFGLAFFPATA